MIVTVFNNELTKWKNFDELKKWKNYNKITELEYIDTCTECDEDCIDCVDALPKLPISLKILKCHHAGLFELSTLPGCLIFSKGIPPPKNIILIIVF